jgi:hypothetical protein
VYLADFLDTGQGIFEWFSWSCRIFPRAALVFVYQRYIPGREFSAILQTENFLQILRHIFCIKRLVYH